MLKRVWMGFLVFLVTLSLAVPAFAQGTPGGKSAEPATPVAPADKPGERAKATAPGEPWAEKPTGEREAAGKVVTVSANKKTLVLDTNGRKISFWVGQTAAKDLPKLKRGDRVKVRYTDEGGQLTAQEVTKS